MQIDKNLVPLVVTVDVTIKEVLARINKTDHLIQLVVNAEGFLLGTVTDGDIRRALIEGTGLDAAVECCMHHDPVFSRTSEDAIALLAEYTGHVNCIPVVDDAGRPRYVVTDAPTDAGIDQALILAGGFGKRLGERTRSTPKPLLQVGGRPVIDHLIYDLRHNGVKHIFIAAHYLGDQIMQYVDALPDDFSVEVLIEENPLGTAGALGLIVDRINSPLLVVNGDIVSRTDFGALSRHHFLHGRHATIGAARFEFDIPFGVLEHDANGSVRKIVEKPRNGNFVSAGIYILEPEICRLVEESVRIDMPALLSRAIDLDMEVGIFPIHEYWLDLGRPEDFQLAEDQREDWLKR